MDVSLLDQIKIAQHEKGQPLLILIEKFTPLIKSYSRALNYEDAENDKVDKNRAMGLTYRSIFIFGRHEL